MIGVSEAARTILRDLLANEETPGKAVRIQVDDYT